MKNFNGDFILTTDGRFWSFLNHVIIFSTTDLDMALIETLTRFRFVSISTEP